MTTHLHDDPELDALLRAADPADGESLHRIATSEAATELRTAINAGDIRSRQAPRRYLRPSVLLAAAVAAVATTLGLTLINPSSSDSAYGAELVRFAENSPRFLLDVPGWQVTDVYEESSTDGEMTFQKGDQRLDVLWVRGAGEKESDKYDLTSDGTVTIEGRAAYLGHYANSTEFEAIWSVGDQAYDARGVFADKAAFAAVATTLHRVDVDTWIAAMPDNVVKPSNHDSVVGQMLSDIPQPQGFDASDIGGGNRLLDRYQLGAKVTGAVSCAWIQQWAHGTASERQQAIDAMATARHWKVLLEMQADGAYPDVVWEIADYMADKPNHMKITKGVSLEEWSKPALGC